MYIKSINQNIDGNYKPRPPVHLLVNNTQSLQNVSNKPMKFHDDNQNNTQYVRIGNIYRDCLTDDNLFIADLDQCLKQISIENK